MASARVVMQAFQSLYRNHPVKMNVITGGTLGCVADIVCQRYVEDAKSLDLRRLAAMTMFGSSYTGFAVTYIYGSYKFILPAALRSTTARQALGSTVIDNFVHCPLIYTPTFYITTGMMQGQTYEEAKHELVSRYWETATACWVFWFPAMLGNFYLLPPQLIVAVMQVENFAWNIIIDYIAHRGPEVASEYVRGQIDKIPAEDGVEEVPQGAGLRGGARGVNVLADAFKKELAARFRELNQQLVEKDKTIAQLRYDLDMLQTKYDERRRAESFSNQLSSIEKKEDTQTKTDTLVVTREDLRVLVSELMQAGVQDGGAQPTPGTGIQVKGV